MDKRILYLPAHEIWLFLFSENMELLREYILEQTSNRIDIQWMCNYCKMHSIEVEACTRGGESNPFWERKLKKIVKILDDYGIYMKDENRDFITNEILGMLDEYDIHN